MKMCLRIAVMALIISLVATLSGCWFNRKTTLPQPTGVQEERAKRNAEKLRLKGHNPLEEAETGEGFPHFKEGNEMQ
jgi:hypothetical protein